MAEQTVSRADALRELLQGLTPHDPALRREITVGLDSLTDFLKEHYLQTYIPEGGSKIKFITGRPGCGKTHLAQTLLDEAQAEGF